MMQISKEDQEYKTWVLKQTKRFQEDETEIWPGMGSPRQQDMVEFWEYNRPKMHKSLMDLGILKETAYVLESKTWETTDKNREAGMFHSNARRQAEQDWLIMDPEEPGEIG